MFILCNCIQHLPEHEKVFLAKSNARSFFILILKLYFSAVAKKCDNRFYFSSISLDNSSVCSPDRPLSACWICSPDRPLSVGPAHLTGLCLLDLLTCSVCWTILYRTRCRLCRASMTVSTLARSPATLTSRSWVPWCRSCNKRVITPRRAKLYRLL